ncbi:hypothetical protein NXS19_001333 [Fusarium pseudograminearum]|nr:hypothetical protein NXS19_001333 [Fusarium pseudograminearum]
MVTSRHRTYISHLIDLPYRRTIGITRPIPEQRWPKELLIFVVGFHAYLVTGSGAAREQACNVVITLESHSTYWAQ